MLQSVRDTLGKLLPPEKCEEVLRLADRGLAPPGRPKSNSHIHLPPNFSAFRSVAQAVELAAGQDVRVVGLSNYYDFTVYGEFTELARARGIFPLFGLEIIALIDELVKSGVKVNDPGNPGKIYICGKGICRFGRMTRRARTLMDTIRRSDRQRMKAMTAKMAAIFEGGGLKTGLDDQRVIDLVARRSACPPQAITLQERHVALAFQEALFRMVPPQERAARLGEIFGAQSADRRDACPTDAVKVQNEIRAHLMKTGKPAFVAETFLGFDEAYRLVLELGGIPCYPTLADGANPICAYEDPVDGLIERIKARGIYCAELIPIRNQPDVLVRYVKAMRQAGLVITAGTEHNTLDMLPIEPACAGGRCVPEEIKDIFWEGARVVAAHQFLAAHGRCGYVDAQGNLNGAYGDPEKRIEAFRRIGAAVIQSYFEMCAK